MARWLTRKVLLRFVLAAGVFVPIAIFIAQVDFKVVLYELSNVGHHFFILIAISFIAYLLSTLGWWVCLGEERKRVSFLNLFVIRQVGETVGLYNPSSVIGGDILKNELLKPFGMPSGRTAQSIVISRITAVLSQLFLLTVTIIWFMFSMKHSFSVYIKYGLWSLLFVLCVLQFLLFFLLNRKQSIANGKKYRTGHYFFRWIYALQRLIDQTPTFFQRQPITFWLSYLFFALHWVVGSMEFYFILSFLGYDCSLMQSVLLDMGVVLIKSIGAFVPGQLGVEELGNKLMLTSIGILTVSLWITVSVLRRARQICWILIGIICYIFIRKPDSLKLFKYGNTVRQS